MNDKKNLGQLTFGFDIGIASVGWAVLNEARIVDLGVRAFDKAETAKEGESLNLARRTARLMRRRLRRRAWRLTKVARLLKKHGVINDVALFKPENPFAISLWELRQAGLDRLLTPEEWARVIYHLCKHRGFHWVSKAEKLKEDGASESGKVKKSLAATNALMKAEGYRTAAEMVLSEFPEAQRNKQGEYTKALERELLSLEFAELFKQQRGFNNLHTSAELEHKLCDRKTGLFWAQKPSLSGEALLKMLGKCTFEKSEYRAPKASFTAERHVWLTRLNNLRLVVDGSLRPLTADERRLVIDLPYNQAGDLKYKQLKSLLVKQAGLSETTRFTGLTYPSASQLESGKAKDPEDGILVKMPAFQALRKTLSQGLETEWQGMVNAAFAGDTSLLDQIAWVLSIYKEDDEVERQLNKLNLPNKAKMVEALLGVRFDKFSNLSLKALYKIVPSMENGQRYDEACIEAGYHHSQLVKADDTKHQYLPPFYSARDNTGKLIFNENLDIPRNPVVLRALNQARKVCNALVKKYGSPYQVNIEMARDLSRPLNGHWTDTGKYIEGRRDIEKLQLENRDKNQGLRNTFNETFNSTGELKGRDFEKWQLYEEQQGKCAYSQVPLDIYRLFDLGYVEIDHALPRSRSFDYSKNNKVLVLSRENQNKGNQTPFEYLDGKNNSERWHQFTVWVNSNKAYRQAKRNRLLKKDFGEQEAESFRDRNLNDTRYICKFFKNYVEQNLQLAENSEVKRCVVLSGQMTAFLRNRWGLTKVRADSDRHHALDAVVVAAANHSMVKRLSDYARRKELEKVSQGFVDVTTGEVPDIAMYNQLNEHFPWPWESFRQELEARLKQDNIELLRTHCEKLGNYTAEDLAQIKPLFVSRAPQRRNGGELHEAKIRSRKIIESEQKSFIRVQLTSLTMKSLDNVIEAHGRNKSLVDALKERLNEHGGDAKKAFKLAFYKPTSEGKEAPLVKSVKIASTQRTGIFVRGGIADLGTMQKLNVYLDPKNDKYIFEPVYKASYEKLINKSVETENTKYLFSLNKNDYVRLVLKGTAYQGYFVMYESDGRLNLRLHDQPLTSDIGYFRKSISDVTKVEKLNIDVLGNIYPAQKEARGLA